MMALRFVCEELNSAALLFVVDLLLSVSAWAQVVAPPFQLSWVEGRCPTCRLRSKLVSALFTSRNEAWGVGATGPEPGVEGMGFRVLLHTQDGGRTWAEVPQTESYSIAPSVAFLDADRGWLETYKGPVEGEIVLRTTNGGKSWEDVTGSLPVFPQILDANHWWGVADTQLTGGPDGQRRRRALARTADGGRTWTKVTVPGDIGDFPVIRFLSPDVGWIGNIAQGRFEIYRTNNGGETWTKSILVPSKRPFQIVDLFFLDGEHGWLIADYTLAEGINGAASYLYMTTDGGASWKLQNDMLQNRIAVCVRFLSKTLGFVFTGGSDEKVDRGAAASLMYTVDAGATWQMVNLQNYVSGCQVLGEDLICSAQGKESRLKVLTIHPK